MLGSKGCGARGNHHRRSRRKVHGERLHHRAAIPAAHKEEETLTESWLAQGRSREEERRAGGDIGGDTSARRRRGGTAAAAQCGVAQPVPRTGQAALPLFAGACGRLEALGRPRRSTLERARCSTGCCGGRVGKACSRRALCRDFDKPAIKIMLALRPARKKSYRGGPRAEEETLPPPRPRARSAEPQRARGCRAERRKWGCAHAEKGEVKCRLECGQRAQMPAHNSAQLSAQERRGGPPADGAAAVPRRGAAQGRRSFDTMLLRCVWPAAAPADRPRRCEAARPHLVLHLAARSPLCRAPSHPAPLLRPGHTCAAPLAHPLCTP
jgi:hypothetical protein